MAGFCEAGRDLADLHLKYEELTGHRLKEERSLDFDEKDGSYYRVEKLRYGKKSVLEGGKERKEKTIKDKSCIRVNKYLVVSGIPEQAYRYEVNGRTPLDWLVDRYKIVVDEESGIKNDANEWRKDDVGYIVRLIGQLVRVGVESYKIMESLPSPF